jgi:translocation-and-assembly-module (TAM) inner membrane subunit TamB-like protein
VTAPPEPDRLDPAEHGEAHGLADRLEETVEHAVETVEHKVEEAAAEVAEHVPEPIRKPVRWTIHKLILLGLASFVALVVVVAAVGGWYVWNRTEWAAHELTGRVNRALIEHSDVELTVGGVRGNPLRAVTVFEPRVRFRDGGGPVVFEARSMRLRYSTWNLLTARRRAIVIEVEHPILRLGHGPDGRMRVPVWRAGPTSDRPPRAFDFLVRLRDGEVHLPESELGVLGLDLDAAAATEPTQLEVRSMSWDQGLHGLRLHRLRGAVAVQDSVILRIDQLQSSEFALNGVAAWKRGEEVRRVRATVDDLRWTWLARLFHNRTLDVPGQGSFVVDATGRQTWSGVFRTRATWSDLPLLAQGDFTWGERRLTLAPLRGASPAGTLEGRVAWSKAGWEVAGNARDADPAHWDAIGLAGWPEGRLNGSFRYAVDTRAAPRSRLVATLAASEWSGWRADSARVTVDAAAGGSTFDVRATRRGGVLTLAGRSAAGGWTGDYVVAHFPLDEWPDGRNTGIRGTVVEGKGQVEGARGGLRVTGTLEGAQTDWLGMHAARWRLSDMQGALLPKPDLTAQAGLADLTFLGIHFDSAAAPFHLGDGVVAFPELAAHASDTLLTLAGEARWGAQGWNFTATRAELRSQRFHWVAEPPVTLAGDARGVRFERLVAADGAARLELHGRWGVLGGSYDWTGRATALDLSRLGLPVEWAVGGITAAELRVTGPSGDPRWTLTATASSPDFGKHAADSVALELVGSPGHLDLRRADLMVGEGKLSARGEVTGMARPWPDTLTGSGILRWVAGGSRWRGTVEAAGLPLDRAATFAPAARGWTGRLSGTLDVGGSPARPELELKADARPLAYRDFRMEGASLRARYGDQRLRVSELRMAREGAISTVRGEMPLDLALGRQPAVPESPMSWQLDLPNADFGLLPLFVPQLGTASGRLDVDARVAGTPRHPDLSGSARVRGGRVRLAGREEVLDNVTATLTLDESRITLDTLVARQQTRQGEPGRVWGSGAFLLRGLAIESYDVRLQMRNFTALETGAYAARFDGDFHITPGPRIGGQRVPYVRSDNVEIQRAVVLYDFLNQTEAEQVAASTQPLYWTYHLELRATDNLFWRPSDGDIEFSADLALEQSADSLLMYGEMSALRGSYYFLDNRFTVRRADLTFDNVGGVNPLVTVEASTRLKPTTVVADPSRPQLLEEHEVTVRITGRAREPVIEFVSDPNDLDENQILAELTVGRFQDAPGRIATRTVANPFENYLVRQLNRQLSAELSRAFRGYLTDWELSRETGTLLQGEGGVILGVGSQINRNLALRYRQRLPGTTQTRAGPNESLLERDIEAEYRLNRFFSITSELAQRRPAPGSASTTASTPDFNVNLKARWEY